MTRPLRRPLPEEAYKFNRVSQRDLLDGTKGTPSGGPLSTQKLAHAS
jgi:hypothetical protein